MYVLLNAYHKQFNLCNHFFFDIMGKYYELIRTEKRQHLPRVLTLLDKIRYISFGTLLIYPFNYF